MKTTEIAPFMADNGIKSRRQMALALDVDIDRLRRWLDGPEQELPGYIALAFAALYHGLEPWPARVRTEYPTDPEPAPSPGRLIGHDLDGHKIVVI